MQSYIMALYRTTWHKRGLFCLLLLYLTYPAEGFPWADLREILHGPPQMPNVQNRVKILPKSLTV